MVQRSATPTPNPSPQGGGRSKMVPVGVILGAHGIRGEVKLKSFTGEPGAIDRKSVV